MSSVMETKKALESYLAANWTLTAIHWPNVPFQPRKDAQGNSLPYIMFSYREVEYPGGGNITLGSLTPWYRWVGFIFIQVLVPENYSDSGLIVRLCGSLTDLWRMHTILYNDSASQQGVIRARVPWSSEVGTISGWYRWNWTCPYSRDARS
jgi:hypothetical protein